MKIFILECEYEQKFIICKDISWGTLFITGSLRCATVTQDYVQAVDPPTNQSIMYTT